MKHRLPGDIPIDPVTQSWLNMEMIGAHQPPVFLLALHDFEAPQLGMVIEEEETEQVTGSADGKSDIPELSVSDDRYRHLIFAVHTRDKYSPEFAAFLVKHVHTTYDFVTKDMPEDTVTFDLCAGVCSDREVND